MTTVRVFGDVVRFSGKDLVFLGLTPEIIYLAPMPNLELSQKVVGLAQKKLTNTAEMERSKNNEFYCFIELTTEEFKQRIAHYGSRGNDQSEYTLEDFMDKIGELNTHDKKCLQTEILEDAGTSEDLKVVVRRVSLID